MDSGNSDSMQSSSGGDEEFDSRGESSISSFLNPSPHFGSILQPPPFLTHQNPTLFYHDQNSQNLDIFPQSNASTQYHHNNDLIWSGGLRSKHNYGNFENLLTAPSSLPSRTQSIPSTQGLLSSPSSSLQLRADADGRASNVVKNPKKRTRSSRRAPTTVLTTDTTNFRQMVQEFTGIPASPFLSYPCSGRLDLFSAASALSSGAKLDSLEPLFPRPSSDKVISPFPSHSTSPLNSTIIDATQPTCTLGASTSNNSSNYPNHLLNLPHDHNIPLQPSLNNLDRWEANPSMNVSTWSGFPSQEISSAVATTAQVELGSGETVRSDDGIQENLVSFD